MNRSFFKLLILAVFFSACNFGESDNHKQTEELQIVSEVESVEYPKLLIKALDAHGGLKNWQKYAGLRYRIHSTLGGNRLENQLINLKNRKVKIIADAYTLGMDGKEVWVSPNLAAFGNLSPRFYHNLVFYFYAMPFVLADKGIQYEELGDRELDGKLYKALRISYKAGVGDSPEDFYIAHFNPETYQLEALLYTVTYFSGEQNEKYNCLLYPRWNEVEGLLLPEQLEGHKFAADTIGELRYTIQITKPVLSQSSPADSLFSLPATAEIDSLKK